MKFAAVMAATSSGDTGRPVVTDGCLGEVFEVAPLLNSNLGRNRESTHAERNAPGV